MYNVPVIDLSDFDNTGYKDSIPTVTSILNEYDQSITVNK